MQRGTGNVPSRTLFVGSNYHRCRAIMYQSMSAGVLAAQVYFLRVNLWLFLWHAGSSIFHKSNLRVPQKML